MLLLRSLALAAAATLAALTSAAPVGPGNAALASQHIDPAIDSTSDSASMPNAESNMPRALGDDSSTIILRRQNYVDLPINTTGSKHFNKLGESSVPLSKRVKLPTFGNNESHSGHNSRSDLSGFGGQRGESKLLFSKRDDDELPEIGTLFGKISTPDLRAVESEPPVSRRGEVYNNGTHFGKLDQAPNLGDTVSAREEAPNVLSFFETLDKVEIKLRAISVKMNEATAQSTTDSNTAVLLVTDVRVIIADALGQLEALKGQPMDVIMSWQGKVLTITEMSSLLLTVLDLICTILSSASRFAAAATPAALVDVGAALGEFLTATFSLIAGLYVTIHPNVGSVVETCIDLKLDDVVAVLYGNF